MTTKTIASLVHLALSNGKNLCGTSGASGSKKDATCPECLKVAGHVAKKEEAKKEETKKAGKKGAAEPGVKLAKGEAKGEEWGGKEPSEVKRSPSKDGKRGLLYSEVIEVVGGKKAECPHRSASGVAMKSWNALLKSKTVGEFKENGGDLGYLRWYALNGIVTQAAPKK